MTNVNNAAFEIDLDGIEDLPEYVTPTPGAYGVMLTLEKRIQNEKPAVRAQFVITSVEELVKPEEANCKPGDIFTMQFLMDNEYGQGNFKKLIGTTIKEAFPQCRTVTDIVDAADGGLQAVVVTKLRKDRNDKEKVYVDLERLILV